MSGLKGRLHPGLLRRHTMFKVLGSAQREPIHYPRPLPTHLQGKVLKFPFSGSNTWFSTRANPKPMVNTARVRMKRRVTPNTAAQALNLLAGVEKGCQLWEPLKEPSPPLQKQPRVGERINRTQESESFRSSRTDISIGCWLHSGWQLTPRAGGPPPPQPFRLHESPRFHPSSLWTVQHPTTTLLTASRYSRRQSGRAEPCEKGPPWSTAVVARSAPGGSG